MKSFPITLGARKLDLGRRTCIMGILNVTPDSFSDGGRFFNRKDALAQADLLVAQGADIIDIGGESSRPFSDPVSLDEELGRVIPVISALKNRADTPISIDTTKAIVAKEAIAAGACLINDISSLRLDPDMADTAAALQVPVVLMHMRGTPKTMQVSPTYTDVVGEISDFFENRIQYAVSKGIPRERIIADPGIGFGKTIAHNLTIIKDLSRLEALEVPILVGPSRKAFIRHILKKEGEGDIPTDRTDVAMGTQAIIAASICNGAHMVRVHDVAETRTTAKLMDALNNACSTG